MPVTLTDGTTTITLVLKSIREEERWRQKNIPLINNPPYVIDLGMEMRDVQIEAMAFTSTLAIAFRALKNPVQVTESTYPLIEVGYWRFNERHAERKPGDVGIWTLRARLRRDWYVE